MIDRYWINIHDQIVAKTRQKYFIRKQMKQTNLERIEKLIESKKQKLDIISEHDKIIKQINEAENFSLTRTISYSKHTITRPDEKLKQVIVSWYIHENTRINDEITEINLQIEELLV